MTASCMTLSEGGKNIKTISENQAKDCQLLGNVEGQAADRYDARVFALNEAALLKATHILWEKVQKKNLGLVYKFEAKAYLCK